MNTTNHYLSDLDLAARYAVSRVTIWRWAQRGHFPRPVRLGPNCTRWRSSDVEAWEAERAPDEAAATPAAEAR